MERRLLLLSGLSGDGKRALVRFWDKVDPSLLSDRPCVYTSRRPDPGEIRGMQFACLSREEIHALADDAEFIVQDVRSDAQAIDFGEVERLVLRPGAKTPVFVEVFHTLARELEKRAIERNIPYVSIFLLPGSRMDDVEIKYMTLQRLIKQGRNLSAEELIMRAESGPDECRAAEHYMFRVVNTAGEEDLDEWGECGRHKGQQGRPVNSLDDLGPNARWLAETFRHICENSLTPPRGASFLVSQG